MNGVIEEQPTPLHGLWSLLLLGVAILVLLPSAPAYGQPKDLFNNPCPHCGGQLPRHFANCPSQRRPERRRDASSDDVEKYAAIAEAAVGLFGALDSIFSELGDVFGSGSSVRAVAPVETPSQARTLANAAASLANSQRQILNDIADAMQSLGRGGLSPIATAPVVTATISAIAHVHAYVHATVGAQILGQMRSAEGRAASVAPRTPSLTNLRPIEVPRQRAATLRPLLDSPSSFRKCSRTGIYIASCPCKAH